ncbi:hypothetical protein [Ammonifex degensii]|uniref:hypothetical protein n=1 Tax=Ammonifex degensii TaxID=42838 RepID=UPI0012EAEA18|nr:hypothetical protein [Ammonifex degensii]
MGYGEIPAGGTRPRARTGRGSYPTYPPPLYPHRQMLPGPRAAPAGKDGRLKENGL